MTYINPEVDYLPWRRLNNPRFAKFSDDFLLEYKETILRFMPDVVVTEDRREEFEGWVRRLHDLDAVRRESNIAIREIELAILSLIMKPFHLIKYIFRKW